MSLGWWVYGYYLWGPQACILCQGLAGPCMCMSWGGICILWTIMGLWCLGDGCVGCQHLLGYSTLCVCWIGVCGLFGVLLCCVIMCKGILCVGGCKWRVGMAMCQFCGLGKVCSWGWDMLVATICTFGGFSCIWRIGIVRFVQYVHQVRIRLSKSSLRVFNWFAH